MAKVHCMQMCNVANWKCHSKTTSVQSIKKMTHEQSSTQIWKVSILYLLFESIWLIKICFYFKLISSYNFSRVSKRFGVVLFHPINDKFWKITCCGKLTWVYLCCGLASASIRDDAKRKKMQFQCERKHLIFTVANYEWF